MHETFWTLVRDRAHWEFEIFLMVFFDVVLAGIWLFFVRATARWRKAQAIKLQTPTGICDGCGGTVKHLIESGIEWCFGCGEIKVAERAKLIAQLWEQNFKDSSVTENKIQTKESK